VLSRVSGALLPAVFDLFDLTKHRAVVAAISGGGDSMALLLLLQDHIRRRRLSTRIVGVTVDHGLRPESAMEARAVEAFCAARGITHRTLRWEGEKPAAGLSAAARRARYALLGKVAEAAGTDMVFTGHSLDDQFETVAMRSARGEGRGLAGMAPATLYRGCVWILRPLIETGRETLRDYLRMQGVAWIEDPSNENLRYERTRMRRLLAARDDADADVTLGRIRTAQVRRIALGEQAAGLIDRHFSRVSPGLYRIGREFFDKADHDAALYAFRALLATIGGRQYLPEITRAAALFAKIRSGNLRATSSRTLIDARKRHVWLHRERRGLPAPGPACDGMIWDNRFRVKGGGNALIAPGVSLKRDLLGCDAPAGLVAAALSAEPAMLSPADSEASGSDLASLMPVVSPFLEFMPSFDIGPARAMARLVGSENPPAPPLEGHKYVA
jgi:tRNA(Ile)-lysidine synthase